VCHYNKLYYVFVSTRIIHFSCWIARSAFVYAVALPVGLVLLTNVILYVVIMVYITQCRQQVHSNNATCRRMTEYLRLGISMVFLLGKFILKHNQTNNIYAYSYMKYIGGSDVSLLDCIHNVFMCSVKV
jgi:hypothetical protein